ncbi:MAG: type II toxin-antitoxin system Phd/YefM family antitoxin [Campylobacterales bacterium]
MHAIFADTTASITELKRSSAAVLSVANERPIAILNRNIPSAYLVLAKTFERMMELIDDQLLVQSVRERLAEGAKPVRVTLDEL